MNEIQSWSAKLLTTAKNSTANIEEGEEEENITIGRFLAWLITLDFLDDAA